jgi:hypothetical protein
MKTYRSTKKQKKNTKKTMSKTIDQTYAELYQKLDIKEDKNNIYKMTKLRERKPKEFNQIKYIKDAIDRLLVNDDEIKNRWRKYFDSWTTHLMTLTSNLFGEFKNLR